MRTFSRHLPPRNFEDIKTPLIGWAILISLLTLVAYWIYSEPYKVGGALAILGALIAVAAISERRRLAKFREDREDTICDFARSFDLRKVDPWIVRATYEAFGHSFDTDNPRFPLRTSDLMGEDLKIDGEDIDDLIREVAARAGYDISDCSSNPLYDKVLTVGDFVHFLAHQPKLNKKPNKSEMAMPSKPSD